MKVTGIIHAHSSYSYDGKLSLSEWRALARERGIQFVCLTEHTDELTPERADAFMKECDALSDDTFRFIPGFEVPYYSKENGTHAHVLMIGCRGFYGSYAKDIDALRAWTSRTPFVVLAHPVRNHFKVDDGLLYELTALEVWNQQYEGKRVPRPRSLALLEALRKKKPQLVGIGGVDFHRREHFGSPLITLESETSSEADILSKLQTGSFTVASTHAFFFGTLPNTDELIRKHRLESAVSVVVIVLGKFVNKTLKALGLSLPKSLKESIRKRL